MYEQSDDNYYSWIMASQGSFYHFILHVWNFSLKKAYMKKVCFHFIEHSIIISLHFPLLHISLCYFPKLKWKKVKVLVAQSCLTLCNPPRPSVHGILQATILEWIAIPFSRRSPWPRDQTGVSCIAGSLYLLSYKGSHFLILYISFHCIIFLNWRIVQKKSLVDWWYELIKFRKQNQNLIFIVRSVCYSTRMRAWQG